MSHQEPTHNRVSDEIDKNNPNYDCLNKGPISSTQFSFEGKLLYPNYNWNNTIQYPSQLYKIVLSKSFQFRNNEYR